MYLWNRRDRQKEVFESLDLDSKEIRGNGLARAAVIASDFLKLQAGEMFRPAIPDRDAAYLSLDVFRGNARAGPAFLRELWVPATPERWNVRPAGVLHP